jgi:hypothetical protein
VLNFLCFLNYKQINKCRASTHSPVAAVFCTYPPLLFAGLSLMCVPCWVQLFCLCCSLHACPSSLVPLVSASSCLCHIFLSRQCAVFMCSFAALAGIFSRPFGFVEDTPPQMLLWCLLVCRSCASLVLVAGSICMSLVDLKNPSKLCYPCWLILTQCRRGYRKSSFDSTMHLASTEHSASPVLPRHKT